MTRPEVEEFIRLVSNPDSPWGMADHDALELCNYILHLESEAKRKDAAMSAAEAITDWGRTGITQMAMFKAACERVHAGIRSALTATATETETGETK